MIRFGTHASREIVHGLYLLTILIGCLDASLKVCLVSAQNLHLLMVMLGWTRAFVSDMKDASSKDPTVLQCLLFWLVSSMKLDFDRIFQRPKVGNDSEPEYVASETPCVVYDVLAKDVRASLLPSFLAL